MKTFIKLILLLSFISTSIYAQIDFPKLTGRVVDNASLLSKAKEKELTNLLKQHEEKTTNQLVIVTLKSLDDQEIAEYGYQLGRHWGIGQKAKDNGVLLIVAPNERKVRIEVGYGLEGVLTDKISHDIIHEKILKYFKKQDYAKGIELGTISILEALDGEYLLTKEDHTPKKDGFLDNVGTLFFIAVIFSMITEYIISFIGIKKRIYIALAVSTLAAIVVFSVLASLFMAVIVWVFTFLQVILGSFLGSGTTGSRSRGSFGGFSGGGGSFGGGGASGSW